MTTQQTSQVFVEVLTTAAPSVVRVSQEYVDVLVSRLTGSISVSQQYVDVLYENTDATPTTPPYLFMMT